MTTQTTSATQGKQMLAEDMRILGQQANQASQVLALCSTQAKNDALHHAASSLRSRTADILAANELDVLAAYQTERPASMIDRLTLTPQRIEAMAIGLTQIAELADPVGEVMSKWRRPNGLEISRIRIPLGVIGIIYESRPNVTADAGALCLKSGNAAILRGGSESRHSSRAIHECLLDGLRHARLPEHTIQLVATTDRDAVGFMLGGLDGAIDVIVPRGGKSLVERVQAEARVPVFAHLEGICHVYVDRAADLQKARAIVLNAKMRRTGICGSAETLLIDQACAADVVRAILENLIEANCEIRGDDQICCFDDRIVQATEQDWRTEYLDAIISVKIVDGVRGAINHIAQYSSHHTEAIITEDVNTAELFLREVDSAIVMHNASTQFADGGEFGMGGEIGIATGRFHARGPVGVEQLTTFKYIVRGEGQLRPL